MADAKRLRIGCGYGMTIPSSAGTNVTVSASTSGIAWVALWRDTEAITHIGFRYGARTGTPPTYVATIETVDATGLPTGTDIGGGSPTAKTFTPPASTAWDGTWQWIALTNSYTPTIGQPFAITIRYSSGTIDASNCSSFTRTWVDRIATSRLPYPLTLSGGTWTKGAGLSPVFAWKGSSTVFGWPIVSRYTTTVSTAGHRSGMFFTLPSTMGTSFKIASMTGVFRGTASASSKFAIWDSSWTELQSVTVDGDHVDSPGNAGTISVAFPSPATLTYGTKYYIGQESISGAVGVNGIQLDSANDRLAFPLKDNIGLVTWTGSTVEDTTVVPLVEFSFSDITVPSGSGGLFLAPAFNGGMA